MPLERSIADAVRRDPASRAIRRAFRQLTGGGRDDDQPRDVLVACSGGADSTALALALSGGPWTIVLGHAIHDLRPRAEALADRDAVLALARALGVPFVEVEARRDGPGNAEAMARRARYRELAGAARAAGVRWLATAHHADDQLETMLHRLIRGAGPRGLAGIPAVRVLSEGLAVVRPMLEVTRTDAERLCSIAGMSWQTDATNADPSRTRSALRAEVVPALKRLEPAAAEHANRAAGLLAELAGLMDQQARAVLAAASEGGVPLAALVGQPSVVLGSIVRELVTQHGGELDRLPRRTIDGIVGAIREQPGHPRHFDLRGLRLEVDARGLRVVRGAQPPKDSSMSQQTVIVLVGHCTPDQFMLKSAIRRAVGEAEVRIANSDKALAEALAGSHVAMVNRVLDGSFSTGSGLELVRAIAASDGGPAAMLVSNYADAQAESESAGGVPGFGKTDLNSDLFAERLTMALAAHRS